MRGSSPLCQYPLALVFSAASASFSTLFEFRARNRVQIALGKPITEPDKSAPSRPDVRK
ncbi:hypothetical protein BJY01DRAFT_210070 [Aspergillus pseudoustus]|uniref:Secreted protein n=1 Tax=Aspergillus pseudoustus TaxID=1810923 RepID=A0ABR4KDS8_9EURO